MLRRAIANAPQTDLNLTDTHDASSEPYILTPAEALNVFTDANDEPFGSEGDDPALLEKRAEVMRWEDAILQKFMDKNQLGRWAQAAVEHADRTVRFRHDGNAAVNGNSFTSAKGNGAPISNGHAVDSVRQDDEDIDEIA